jgi:hypothetical protein
MDFTWIHPKWFASVAEKQGMVFTLSYLAAQAMREIIARNRLLTEENKHIV